MSRKARAIPTPKKRLWRQRLFYDILEKPPIKRSLSDWHRFFVRTRWKTGRRVVLCGGLSAKVRAKKMRQDGAAEFISDALNHE
jgi:hypothetical protein